VSFAYTTWFSETPVTNYTRTFRYYDCGTGGVIINALTVFTDPQDRHIRAQDNEIFAVGEDGTTFSGFTALLNESSDGGLTRYVRAAQGIAGVLIHEETRITTTIQGHTNTRIVREALYYIPNGVLSGTDIVVTPPTPPPP
jgi:hypothetical protein